jgi:hypothetical protein
MLIPSTLIYIKTKIQLILIIFFTFALYVEFVI